MKQNDPSAIAAAVILIAAAVAAGYGPARRAARIDPWNALRHEWRPSLRVEDVQAGQSLSSVF